MTRPLVDQIAQAVLYEGYILYPYRPSVKTRQRWTFGGLYPRAFSEANQGSDPWLLQTQCLIRGDRGSNVSVKVRFLHLIERSIERAGDFQRVPSLTVGHRVYQPWQEAMERSVEITDVQLGAPERREHFVFPASRMIELLLDEGVEAGRIVRDQIQLEGSIEIATELKTEGTYQCSVRVRNQTPFDRRNADDRDAALMRALVSTHVVLTADSGSFVSMTDPPADLQSIAERCENIGCWPVLVGEAGQTDTLLVSPIILSDYPQIAPESPGDLFDGCEIDEILTLRIMTLTDDEKRQVAATDPMAAKMLARTESLARDQLMNLHGVLRPTGSEAPVDDWDPMAERRKLERILAAGIELKPGDRVRLRPKKGGDIFDIALSGMAATIASIEQDFENRIHLAVTIDDDPGRDFGMDGKPGHRFFFSPEEVEIIDAGEVSQ